jgi:hypothetical protein
MGHDTGCLDPDDLDESNCEYLWVNARLEELLAPMRQLAKGLAGSEATR